MARWHVEKRIQKDGTVSYRVKAELPPDPITGKRQTKTGTFRTRKEADRTATQWVTDADNGIVVKTTNITVAELCEQWLDMQRPALKPRTLEHYEPTLRKHVAPLIGAMPVQRVQPVTIDALYASLRAAGHSEHAIHRVHQRLLQVFTYAAKRRITANNPMHAIDAPKMTPEAATVLTSAQIARFLTFAATDTYNPLWLLIVQTGMRRGEALGVRWQDIDLDKATLRVRQCVESLDGKPHLQTPKSAAAARTITLFPESVAALKAHRARQLAARLQASEWLDNDLVFCTATGTPIAPTNALRNLRAIRAKANGRAKEDASATLPDFNIHDLRHTHASHLLADGWDVVRVSRRLGHANPAITLTFYAHFVTDMPGGATRTPAAFAFVGTA